VQRRRSLWRRRLRRPLRLCSDGGLCGVVACGGLCACARRRSLWRRRLRRPLRLCVTEVCRRWPSKKTDQQLPQLISRGDEEPSCRALRNRSLMIEKASPIRSTLRAAAFILFSQIFMRGSITGSNVLTFGRTARIFRKRLGRLFDQRRVALKACINLNSEVGTQGYNKGQRTVASH
jgi:hypothetical protein